MELWNQVFLYNDIKHLVVPHLTPRFLQLLEGHDLYQVLLMLHALMHRILYPVQCLILCPLPCLVLYPVLCLVPYPVILYHLLYL